MKGAAISRAQETAAPRPRAGRAPRLGWLDLAVLAALALAIGYLAYRVDTTSSTAGSPIS
jgi:hypothetical protein